MVFCFYTGILGNSLEHNLSVCYVFRQLIYNYPEQLFGAAGVMAIEHADFAGVERLALVTGTERIFFFFYALFI